MNKYTNLLCLFVFALICTSAGAFIARSAFIPDDYKAIASYSLACVVAYALYVISGESKRDDSEDD